MTTLDRYILRAFARNLALVLLTLICLYGLIEFLETVDDFIEHQAAFKYYLLYPIYLLPVIISNSLPMAVLLATFATIGGFSRSNQLTAMLCGGISFSRISRPLFSGSLILSLLIIVAHLWLVPLSSRESHYIRHTGIKGEPSKDLSSKELYFRDDSRIVSINLAFPNKGLLRGLTIVEINENFMPTKRIQAEMAQYTDRGNWRLTNTVSWEFNPETKAVASFTQQPELIMDLKRRPEEMLQIWDRPEDLTINELLGLSKKLQAEGFDAKSYQMEAHMRLAKSVIPIIMVLVGIPFALQRGRNASFSLGIIISLIIFLIYFILHAVFAVFGAIAILPPLIAAWAANVLMILIGTWFFLRVQS